MNWWLLITPFIAAATGWLFMWMALRLLFRRVIPGKQKEWAEKIGKLSASLLSVKDLEEKITSPENVKKIMPQAEEHIDHFLRVKLVKSMPVVGMFVGDKTINNLKSLFVDELELLFPEIMKNYMGRLQEDLDIEQMVTAKIAAIPPENIESNLLQSLQKELRMIKWLGALLGFVISTVQLVIFHFLA